MHMNIISHHEVNSKDFDWIWNEWAKDMRTVVIAIALINQYSAIFIFWYFSIVWNRLFEIGIWMVVYMLMMYGMICFCVYVPPEHAHLCLYLLICLFAYLFDVKHLLSCLSLMSVLYFLRPSQQISFAANSDNSFRKFTHRMW